jgi:hypothetical protein
MKPIVIDLPTANRFIGLIHRHSVPLKPINVKFIIGLEHLNELIGVSILGRPVNRHIEDGETLEIRRLATNGLKNSCSYLLARTCDVAFSMGYNKVVTYTLQSESGSSLKAVGFTISHYSNSNGKWKRNGVSTTQTRLDGRDLIPSQKKICWEKYTKWKEEE